MTSSQAQADAAATKELNDLALRLIDVAYWVRMDPTGAHEQIPAVEKVLEDLKSIAGKIER
ncbi:hypothetical protein [Paenarthrobacter ureafaciens]|uniref:hypothetical protein n=1 Tax=Paenarthrobacter ureafaciens TaxID=37931 RepID=UPI0011197F32|nr:hypothetical protein [Paenarthrobacter ureafaciens]GLU58560.1 hypothetical protein Pure01_10730 [Paenarthrobacter ureafaciens]GLU61805.1 hypothetical protein Pure02_00550 [Paenarthrobacter ureafaciens]GLU66079.1 hypothetical protein Pure03_00550 [Paenarthrobacter ureafaciens]GLU71597.1 hypothetical protein Pure04_13120 [Paenarthrobacter ureafaciens]GLU74616.1 hypothetical protein Pure05_00560 [Paenarthrobacter ureafaciens]